MVLNWNVVYVIWYDNGIRDMMRAHDLCAIDTFSNLKGKNDKTDTGTATRPIYLRILSTRRPTKLDYFYLCLANRWKSMVMNTWAPSIHRFGRKFNHSYFSERHVALEDKKNEEIRSPNFEAMDVERWAAFDDKIRIIFEETSPEKYSSTQTDTSKREPNTGKGNDHGEYTRLSTVIKETIDQVVSEKTWTKKNGRIVSNETKALYEKRTNKTISK